MKEAYENNVVCCCSYVIILNSVKCLFCGKLCADSHVLSYLMLIPNLQDQQDYASTVSPLKFEWDMKTTFIFQALEFLPFEGKVNLKKPQHIFSVLEDYGLDPNRIPENPHNIYFGRWVRRCSFYVFEVVSLKA